MKLVKIRLTGTDKNAIEATREKLNEQFTVIENGSIRASSRAKYSGSFICYMQVLENGSSTDESN